jgi:hypothetical protein
MTLNQMQKKWITFHDELCKGFAQNRCKLAAPFLSVADPTPCANSTPAIMLVGQATRGDWFYPKYEPKLLLPISERLLERRRATSAFLTDGAYARNRRSAFWIMWRRMKNLTRGPVIWSNVAKVGTWAGNPPWRVVAAQSNLAIATLNAEIETYNPRLIVFVTGYFGRHEIVSKLLKVSRDLTEAPNGIIYSRVRTRTRPAVLWTGHPRARQRQTLSKWHAKIDRLLDQ